MVIQFKIRHALIATAAIAIICFAFHWFTFRPRTFTAFGGPALASSNLDARQTSSEIKSFLASTGYQQVEPMGTHVSTDPSFSVSEFERIETDSLTRRITVISTLRTSRGKQVRAYRFENFWMARPAYYHYHCKTRERFRKSVVDFRERLGQLIADSEQFASY